jgi:hypothetical protein
LLAQLDIAAASGIAVYDDELYVLADDELELPRYDRAGTRRGTCVLLEGALPEQPAQRKAAKPDFEALVALPDGALLALGSGSTTARQRAVYLHVQSPKLPPRVIDLSRLYERLRKELPELNIEGGALVDDELLLASRGNGPRRDNALIHLDWSSVEHALIRSGTVPAEALLRIDAIRLGELAGQPLSVTDIAAAADRLLFSAAAEASPNTYDDGLCVGSVLGMLSRAGEVLDVVGVSPVVKVEGIWATPAEAEFDLLLVADPDDRQARAPLMAATYRSVEAAIAMPQRP